MAYYFKLDLESASVSECGRMTSTASVFSSVRGLVFDLDGVLILSRDAHRRAFTDVLGECGVSGFDYDLYAGWRTPEVFRAVFKESLGGHASEEMIAECARRKSALARQILAREDLLAPGCVDIVRRLCCRYALALASSGSRESVSAFLDRSGLRTSFQSVLSGDDVREAKPDPEIFSRSIAVLGLAPEQCVVIEDAVAGVHAALRAGAKVIGIADGDALRAAGATYVVSSLSELEQLLQS